MPTESVVDIDGDRALASRSNIPIVELPNTTLIVFCDGLTPSLKDYILANCYQTVGELAALSHPSDDGPTLVEAAFCQEPHLSGAVLRRLDTLQGIVTCKHPFTRHQRMAVYSGSTRTWGNASIAT